MSDFGLKPLLLKTSFPSLEGRFRVSISETEQFLTVGLEELDTKRQWNLEIADVNGFAVNPKFVLPAELVSTMLKNAIERAAEGPIVQLGPDSPVVDGDLSEGGVVILTLRGLLYGSFVAEYRFPLNPVETDRVSLLERQLQELREVTALQQEQIKDQAYRINYQAEQIRVLEDKCRNLFAKRYFVVAADGSTPVGDHPIVWNADSPRELPEDAVRLSLGQTTVTVLHGGLYQIHVRILDSPRFHHGLSLRVNGHEVALSQCNYNSMGGIKVNEITELIRLEADDDLSVFYKEHSIKMATHSPCNSRFWGLLVSQ